MNEEQIREEAFKRYPPRTVYNAYEGYHFDINRYSREGMIEGGKFVLDALKEDLVRLKGIDKIITNCQYPKCNCLKRLRGCQFYL